MKIDIQTFGDTVIVASAARRLAKNSGYSEREQTTIAISASELATNIVKYAGKGEIDIEFINGALTIIATDEGPGIKNLEMAFSDNCTDTAPITGDNKQKHRGYGTGLPAVKRLMDECVVEHTSSKGTRIRAVKYL